MLFRRSQIVHHYKKQKDGTDVGSSSGGRGHYEGLVADTAADGDPTSYLGKFQANSALHSHLCHIGNCHLAAQYNDVARVRMETAYNEQASVVRFKVPNAVGLRIAALKNGKRGGKRHRCAAVHRHQGRGRVVADIDWHAQHTQHEQYKLLSEFGVLDGSFKVDALVPVNLRNFPQLVGLYDACTAEKLMTLTHSDYPPIDKSRYELVSPDEEWEKHGQKKTPAARNNKRRRAAQPRTTAVAAETAIVTAKVDRRKAPSLFTTSSQPTPAAGLPSTASHPIEIIGHNAAADRFKTVWSGTPTDCIWCPKRYLLSACPELLEKYVETAAITL